MVVRNYYIYIELDGVPSYGVNTVKYHWAPSRDFDVAQLFGIISHLMTTREEAYVLRLQYLYAIKARLRMTDKICIQYSVSSILFLLVNEGVSHYIV